jgi:hypothetical protein
MTLGSSRLGYISSRWGGREMTAYDAVDGSSTGT